MKESYFVLSWFITLTIGGVIVTIVSGETSVAAMFSGVAFLCSLPFIVTFTLLMSRYMKKQPSRMKVHERAFLLHLMGSVITTAVIMALVQSLLPGVFYLAIFGYFFLDSIFFHSFIQLRYKEKLRVDNEDDGLLDSSL